MAIWKELDKLHANEKTALEVSCTVVIIVRIWETQRGYISNITVLSDLGGMISFNRYDFL